MIASRAPDVMSVQRYDLSRPSMGRAPRARRRGCPPCRLRPRHALEEVFYDFVYEPLLDADGAIEGITAVVTDATERVRARAVVEQAEAERERLTALERAAGQRAEAAEALLRRVYQQAPVAIAVLRGPEHRFEVANPPYVELVGKQVTPGRSVRQVFPELEGLGIFGYERRDTGPELRAVLYYQAGG